MEEPKRRIYYINLKLKLTGRSSPIYGKRQHTVNTASGFYLTPLVSTLLFSQHPFLEPKTPGL